MSILGTLFSKILGHKSAVAAPSITPKPTASAPPPVSASSDPGGSRPAATASPTPVPAQSATPRMDEVDLEHLLDGLVQRTGQKLDWRKSIVDLMKAVGMDSSLAERKQLAQELGYAGDLADSAMMNVWLHGEVMKRIAANGGKVPASLQT